MKTRSRTRSSSSLSTDASTRGLTNESTRIRSTRRKSRTPTIEEGTVADDEDNNILLYDDHEPDHHNKDEKETLDSVTKENGEEKEKEVTVRRKHQRRSSHSDNQKRNPAPTLSSTVKPRVDHVYDHHDASGEDNDILGVVTTSGADDSSDNDHDNEKETDDDQNRKQEDEKSEEDSSSSESTTSSNDDEDDDENSSSSDEDNESSDEDEKDEKYEETFNKPKSSEIQRSITLATEAASKTFAWDTTMKHNRKRSIVEHSNMAKKNETNPLSKVIPGYTAPMSLDTSPLDAYKRTGSMIPTHPIATAVPSNLRAAASTISNANFKQGHKAKYRPPQTNAGPKWFGMEATPLTPQLRSDLAVLRNRNYLDPKKFYKSSDLSTSGGADRMVQLGTVVEGAAEYYSSRMSKRERKGGHSVMEQLMGEVFDGKDSYVRRKFGDISRKKQEEGMKGRRRGGGAKGAKRKSGW